MSVTPWRRPMRRDLALRRRVRLARPPGRRTSPPPSEDLDETRQGPPPARRSAPLPPRARRAVRRARREGAAGGRARALPRPLRRALHRSLREAHLREERRRRAQGGAGQDLRRARHATRRRSSGPRSKARSSCSSSRRSSTAAAATRSRTARRRGRTRPGTRSSGSSPSAGSSRPARWRWSSRGRSGRGAIELEIVFKPEKAWKLKRKGEPGDVEGVAAKLPRRARPRRPHRQGDWLQDAVAGAGRSAHRALRAAPGSTAGRRPARR